jgi:ribulose-phosphate 3-epimerase
MTYIAPSLLAADYAHLADEIKKVEDAGAAYLHLDIMDGAFVPNISFGPELVASIRKSTKLIFDVHLMINDPIRYVDRFVKAGADMITFHIESTNNPEAVIRAIESHEMRVGIAISPATPVDAILPYLPRLAQVTVMTVEPGFGGQAFMMPMLDKVRVLRRYALEKGLKLDIEVDGGINPDNVGYCTGAGANVIVAGSAIFKSKKPRSVIFGMKEAAKFNPFLG